MLLLQRFFTVPLLPPLTAPSDLATRRVTAWHMSLFDLNFLQADAGGSPSLVARGLATAQAAAAAEQIQIQVPNEKVCTFLCVCFLIYFCSPVLRLSFYFVCLGWFNHREGW